MLRSSGDTAGPGNAGNTASPCLRHGRRAELPQGQTLELRVFVDKSVVEAFANDRQAVVRRIYPTRADSVGVSLFSQGGAAKVRGVKAWEMMPGNPY